MNLRRSFAMCTFACVAALPRAAAAADHYVVSVRLSHHGQTFASPRLIVEEGALSSIVLEGESGFTLTLVADRTDAETVKLSTTLQSPYGSLSPKVLLRLGERASVANDDVELEFLVRPHNS